jgi:hypothetical protein
METIDQPYFCQMPGQVFGDWQLQCRLRIFQPHPYTELQTVMITDMGFEMGWFIPYIVERLMDQVINEFQLDPVKVVWIEHYTPEFRKPTFDDFSQVTFEWQDGKAMNPKWFSITPQIAHALFSRESQLLSA